MLPMINDQCIVEDLDASSIVKRIVEHIPPRILDGLNEIRILYRNEKVDSFGCYIEQQGRIELYMDDVASWSWWMKKSYVLPYFVIGMALGHEIDHHVTRNDHNLDRELSAESNALKYVYPSMGFFKPFVKVIGLLIVSFRKLSKRGRSQTTSN